MAFAESLSWPAAGREPLNPMWGPEGKTRRARRSPPSLLRRAFSGPERSPFGFHPSRRHHREGKQQAAGDAEHVREGGAVGGDDVMVDKEHGDAPAGKHQARSDDPPSCADETPAIPVSPKATGAMVNPASAAPRRTA